jgi:EmrB/QacA subfamily drug resistance transporter
MRAFLLQTSRLTSPCYDGRCLALKRKVHRVQKQQKVILWLLALSMFLVVLDSAIINVALPAIKAAFNFDDASLQWVLTAYILTFGGFLMLGGRTADLYGRRRILIAGVAGFTLFSLLVGLAPSGPALIALRALQGLAGAFMAPTALSILLTTFEEGPQRHRALSIWAMVASGGAAAGVFLGGLLTQYLDWRWNFFVNVPVGIFAIVALMKYIPAHIQEAKDRKLDIPGAILVTTGLMALVYALTLASSMGWLAPMTLTFLIASVLLLAAFIFNESRAAHPLMPLGIFRIRNVSGGNLVMLPVVAGALGMFYFSSLYIQNVLQYSPVQTGLCFLPVPIIIGIVSNRAPQLLSRFGFKRLLVVGLSLITVSIFSLSFISADTSYWLHLLPAFVVLAFGFGITFVSLTVAATAGVPPDEAGLASGLINTSQQIGSALGIAILAVVASTVTSGALAAGQDMAAASLQGYQQAFLCSSILIAIALAITIFVIQTPKDQPATPPPPTA